MNGKPDEHLDQWIRQSLGKLPNALPPGTTFDAERLWTQVRPELQKPVALRRLGWVWWAAAACLISVVLSWYRLNQPPEPARVLARTTPSSPPVAVNGKPGTIANPRNMAVPAKNRSAAVSRPQPKPDETTAPVPVGDVAPPSVADAAQPLLAASGDSATLIVAEQAKTSTSVAAHKRRFQVVHVNELQAEDEIRPTPHRTDRFVRLGTVNSGQPVPEMPHPVLTWPLTTKSNP